MLHILSFLTLLGFVCSEYSYHDHDVYWRDYDGTVPPDALVGWYDGHEPLYIVNGYLHGKGLLISHVKRQQKSISVAGINICTKTGKFVREINKHIQILCTKHPHLFKWVNRIDAETPANINKIVVGGFQHGYNLYIGRSTYKGEKIITKYIHNAARHYAGYSIFPSGGEEVEYSDNSIEVLIYDEETTNCNLWNPCTM